MCFGQSILYIYIEGNYQYICSYSHFINSFGFVLIDLFSYFAFLFSYDLMTFFRIVFGFLFIKVLHVYIQILIFFFSCCSSPVKNVMGNLIGISFNL